MKGVTVTCVKFASKAVVEFFMTNLILKTIYFFEAGTGFSSKASITLLLECARLTLYLVCCFLNCFSFIMYL